jgi:4-hydroxy-3-polyprenylbenzoate decarboxylase
MNRTDAGSDLRQFLAWVDAAGALHRVTAEVDPDLEIAAITDRVCKGAADRRALLFTRVRGHRTPVVTNLFGSAQRAARALGVVHAGEAADRLDAGLAAAAGGNASSRLRDLLRAPQYAPVLLDKGLCHEFRLSDPDPGCLPALRSWPGDGGRYLTLPQVVTRDPEGGPPNCGMYRVQLLGPRRAAVHWRESSDAARHCRAWHMRGVPMPVSIALGGDPAMLIAAAFPLPSGVDEAAFASLLSDRPMVATPSLHSDLPVPAAAEFVIEGLVFPGETVPEGPFGNHTGFYQPPARVPVLRVHSISHRAGPIFPTTVVGPPPMENCYLAKVSERLLTCLLRIDHPDIVDIHMPVEGLFHGASLIAVKRGTDGRELIRDLWREGPLRTARLLVVAVADEIGDTGAFFWRVLNRLQPPGGLVVQEGRLGIDATLDPPGLTPLQYDDKTAALVKRRWAEYGFD